MPKYGFTAIDTKDKRYRCVLDARDEDDLRKILRDQGMILLKCKTIEEKHSGYRLKANETAEFSRQMASMLGSGITVVRALEIIKERDFKERLKLIYSRLHRDVQQGYTLSEAMRLQPKAFPELFVNMYASGEASGRLEHVAQKMAVHYEKEHHLNGKVQMAMMYPMILLIVTILVVMVIFTVVLPSFFTLFEDMELPLITRLVLGISVFMQKYWLLVIIGTLIVIALIQFLLTIRPIALAVDRAKLYMPVAGRLLKIIYTARFSRTLASLYTSGISMINALEITSTIIGSKYIEDQFDELIKDVRNGNALSEAISKIIGFDKKLSASVLIGEESGRLDAMLESNADSFDYEAEIATTKLVHLVEPVMIVIMALIIGTVMLSVFLPLFALYNNIETMY